jgi:hypothetical protein
MPKVPVYQPSQVQPTVAPTQRVQSPLSPQAASITGQQMQQAGQALSGAGSQLARMVQDEQQKVNRARLRDANNQLRATINETKLEYEQLKGSDIVGGKEPVMQEYMRRVEDARQSIFEELGNDDLRYAFTESSDELLTRYSESALAYEAEQAELYKQDMLNTEIINASEELALNYAQPKFADNLQSLLREKGSDQGGLSGDALDRYVQDNMAELSSVIFEGMIERNDLSAAREFYEAVRPFTSELADRGMRFELDKQNDAAEIIATVDGFVDEGLDLGQALVAVQEKEGSGPNREALEARVLEVYRNLDAARTANANEAFNTGYDLITNKGRTFDQLPSSLLNQMTVPQKRQLQNLSAPKPSGLDRDAYATVLDSLSTEGKDAAMLYLTENSNRFSDSDYRNLLIRINNATDRDAESILTMQQSVRSALAGVGISDTEKTNQLTGMVDLWSLNFQTDQGRKPTDVELGQFIQEMVVEVKFEKTGWFGGTETNRPFEVTGKNVFANIPDEFEPEVLRALQRTGEVLNVDQIDQLYLQAIDELASVGITEPSQFDIGNKIEEILIGNPALERFLQERQ